VFIRFSHRFVLCTKYYLMHSLHYKQFTRDLCATFVLCKRIYLLYVYSYFHDYFTIFSTILQEIALYIQEYYISKNTHYIFNKTSNIVITYDLRGLLIDSDRPIFFVINPSHTPIYHSRSSISPTEFFSHSSNDNPSSRRDEQEKIGGRGERRR